MVYLKLTSFTETGQVSASPVYFGQLHVDLGGAKQKFRLWKVRRLGLLVVGTWSAAGKKFAPSGKIPHGRIDPDSAGALRELQLGYGLGDGIQKSALRQAISHLFESLPIRHEILS